MKILNSKDNLEYKKADNEVLVFLGGSCNDKNNWRNSVIRFLEKIESEKMFSLDNLVIANPFISKWNPSEEEFQKQVEWESMMIDQSDIYACYLDSSSDAPISLFELGRALYQYKGKFSGNRLNYRVIVTVHPDYKKLSDIKYELMAATNNWKNPISDINVEKNISAHASKILESYIKLSK